jgi:hypothetical protein
MGLGPSLARLAESPPAARVHSISPWLELLPVLGIGALGVVGVRRALKRLCARQNEKASRG